MWRSAERCCGGLGINFDVVIKNGRVYTPQGLKDFDIWIKEGKIASLGGSHKADQKIDAHGMLILPGVVDAHVHFRDPGPVYKEDWESGSISAAAGGVTTVIDQPNTDPRTKDARSFDLKLDRAKNHSVVDFCINGGPGRIEEQVALGATAIGEIFTYEYTDSGLENLLKEVEQAGVLPTIHAEDGQIVKENTKRLLSDLNPEAYSSARPKLAEAMAIEKVLSWTSRAHICHLSTFQGLDLVIDARKAGKKMTCEVCPHHLLLNRSDYRKHGTFLKINPPLRDPADNQALWAGLRDGLIDIVASDHAPHLPEEKKMEIWEAPAGVPGVETMLPLMLMAVRSNLISLDRLVQAMATKPAQIFGLESKGQIAPRKDADLVLVNPKAITRINADRLHSRAEWTPYEGREAIFPQATIVRGTVVFEDDLQVRPGFGRFQARLS
jgi:dihydroorotase